MLTLLEDNEGNLGKKLHAEIKVGRLSSTNDAPR